MSLLDIAQARKSKLRDGYSDVKAGVDGAATRVEYGVAQSASSGGYVSILIDGSDSAFTVPCDSTIRNGDRVSYISTGGSGKAVSLYGNTAAIASAQSAADAAAAIAEATDQYFWYDSNGAHVSTTADTATGDQNIIMNSNGVLLRQQSKNLAAFTPTSVAFYDGLGNAASNIVAQFGQDSARIGYQGSDNVTIYPGGMEVNTNGLMSCEIAKSGDPLAGLVSRERFPYSSPGPVAYIFNGSPLSGSQLGFVYDGEIIIVFSQGHSATQTLSSTYGGITVAYDGNNKITVSGGSLTSAALGVNYRKATAVDAPFFTFGTSTDEAADRAAISFSAGIGLTARNRFQSVLGKYNANYDGPLVVGNGTDAANRSNAMTVGWDGTVTLGTPLPVASGGTGDTGVSSSTTGTSVITVASGITLQSATFRSWGKMAQVLIGFRVSSALADNATVIVGTLVSGMRPIMATQCGYISNDGYISTTGEIAVRNITGASISTTTTIYTAATYLLA